MQNLTLSITQLNNYIKNIFDNEELLIGVSVYGEVTNFKISNGIAYFDIKEDGAQLSCVKFSAYAPFAKNGDQVIVTGKLNYHVRLGRLSFVASKVEPYGMGELYKKYLELKARLESEGVFDESHKIPLPKYANKIGVEQVKLAQLSVIFIMLQERKILSLTFWFIHQKFKVWGQKMKLPRELSF